MAKKVSIKAQKKLEILTEARRKWDRVHSLVELAASQKTGRDMYLSQLRRAATEVARVFMNGGYGPLADGANQLAILVKRGGSLQSKLGAMRELVGSTHGGIERAEKSVITEDSKGQEE